MTGDAHTDASATARAFVDWLAGDIEGDAPEITTAEGTEALPAAFDARLAQPNPPVVRMLTALCDREDLMTAVIARCWEAIGAALFAVPVSPPGELIENPPDWRWGTSSKSLGFAVYLVWRLATPCPDLKHLSAEELNFLASASRCDPTMLRHLLTWAAMRSDTPNTWSFGDLPPPNTIWEFAAQDFKRILSRRDDGGWSRFDWSSDQAQSLARRIAGTVDAARLEKEAKWFFSSFLTCLIEFDKLSRTTARAAATRSTISTLVGWLAPEMQRRVGPSPNPKVGRLPMPEWARAALRVLPLDELEHDLDRLDAEEERFAERRLGDGVDRHHDEFFDSHRSHLQSEVLTIGWAIGALLDDTERPITIAEVRQMMQRWDEAPLLGGVALLWAHLLRLVELQRSYDHDQIRGVFARLSTHLVEHPGAWAISAREILRQAGSLGSQALDLLSLAAVHDATVDRALARAAKRDSDRVVRDRAGGLIARLDGVHAPDQDMRRWLADSAARAFDGIPLFPHPLTPLARTWLGSTEIEDTLNRCLRQAAASFGEKVRDQGAALEEVLTGMLVSDLEHAFADLSLRLKSGGRPRLASTITVSYRSVTKVQEKAWGCDIALLLNADLRPSVLLRLALLVQIKKPEARRSTRSQPIGDRWRIDLPQLATILEMSESAGYFLICSSGELACVTARWLRGLAAGREALSQNTVTVGYNDVRHTAVNLEQFISELFLGTWLGSVAESTLRFAGGEDADMTPRHIFEIVVHNGDRQ